MIFRQPERFMMYEGRWKYRNSFGLIAAVAVLLVALFAAIPFLVLILDAKARDFFFNKERTDFIISCFAILGYEAFFGLMAYVLYRRSIKNWLKSLIRPDFIEVGRQGLYQKYQDEETYAAWPDILHIECKPVYINRHDKVNDLIVVLKDGKILYFPLSGLARPLESLSWMLMLFIVPFAAVFGFKTFAVSIILLFFFVLFANNRRNRSITEQILLAAHYYQRYARN